MQSSGLFSLDITQLILYYICFRPIYRLRTLAIIYYAHVYNIHIVYICMSYVQYYSIYLCMCTHYIIIAEHSRVVVCPMNRVMSIDTIYMLYTCILYGIHNHVIFSLYGSQNNVYIQNI